MSHCAGQRRAPTPSRTYYVDASEADATHPGTDAANPLKTIAQVNALTLKPGDRVLFKRGQTWSGTQITCAYSGAPGKPLLYDAYGSGALPIIIGDASYGFNNNPNIGKNYLHIRNMEFNGNDATDATVSLGGHDNLMEGCAVHNGIGTVGLWVKGGTTYYVYNTTITNCTVYSNLHSGLCATNGHVVANGVHDITIQDCTCYSNGSAEATDHGIYVGDGYRITVRRNTCYSNFAGGIKSNDTDSAPASMGGNTIDSNTCYSNGTTGIYVTSTNNLVTNNLCYTNTSGGIWFLSTDDGHQVYHNTLVNNGTGNLIFFSGANTNLKLKNNLCVTDHAVIPWVVNIYFSAGDGTGVTNGAGNVLNKNIYYAMNHPDGAHVVRDGAGSHLTLAQWQALAGAQDANSQNADPVVVTQWTDLHLQTTSPCKAAGDATVGVLMDKDNVVRGAAVDIGCYEYV